MTTRRRRSRSPWSSRKLLRGAFAAALAAACGEDRMLVPPPAPPPLTGILLVSAITSGGDPDGDGYRLVVDRGPGTAMPAMGAISLTLDPGTHEVELAEVASQCVVGGAPVELQQTTRYPWDGKVTLTVKGGKLYYPETLRQAIGPQLVTDFR